MAQFWKNLNQGGIYDEISALLKINTGTIEMVNMEVSGRKNVFFDFIKIL
jgi:hypothetical protein